MNVRRHTARCKGYSSSEEELPWANGIWVRNGWWYGTQSTTEKDRNGMAGGYGQWWMPGGRRQVDHAIACQSLSQAAAPQLSVEKRLAIQASKGSVLATGAYAHSYQGDSDPPQGLGSAV